MKLIIYFDNGASMTAHHDQIEFTTEPTDPAFAVEDALNGKTVINWNHVTAIKKAGEKCT